MKKIALIFLFISALCGIASAQLLPSFQFGIKGGVNLTSISNSGSQNLSSSNQAGYLAGFWARIGAAGIHFQPELYSTTKNVTLHDNAGNENKAKFTSIDVPLLIGTRLGALGVGVRFDTGPVISFATNKNQSAATATSNAINLNYKDQNYAWQFGVGLDVKKLSVDLRYEAGLNKIDSNDGSSKTRINLFNLTLGYRLFGI